ncbi:hypothetical protein P4C99_22150, partial [Pontiellaceae bacterium B1224]|nr:hypothetical protein [Pontiellaceae bacterium B1224]
DYLGLSASHRPTITIENEGYGYATERGTYSWEAYSEIMGPLPPGSEHIIVRDGCVALCNVRAGPVNGGTGFAASHVFTADVECYSTFDLVEEAKTGKVCEDECEEPQLFVIQHSMWSHLTLPEEGGHPVVSDSGHWNYATQLPNGNWESIDNSRQAGRSMNVKVGGLPGPIGPNGTGRNIY